MNLPKTLAIACAAVPLAACYQVPQSTKASYEEGTLVVADQPAGGAVTVARAGMPSTGWLVVHAVRRGEPDYSGSIGHVYVPAGPSENVAVPLDERVVPGEEVVVMLHLDTGVPRIFEFANGSPENLDPPVVRDGTPVIQRITLN